MNNNCLSILIIIGWFDNLDERVVDAFYSVNRELGSGLLESVYKKGLLVEFSKIGIPVAQLHPIHSAQLINYLKISKLSVGFLVNFCGPNLVWRRFWSGGSRQKPWMPKY